MKRILAALGVILWVGALSPEIFIKSGGGCIFDENGEALTGTHTIDGETYTFGPAGADAQLATVTGDTLIYTTDACALVTD